MNHDTIKELMTKQKALDEKIYATHKIVKARLLRDKIRAFRAELGELENVVEHFKYWKNNPGKPGQAEEYADGLFFLLSIGVLQEHRPIGIYPHVLKGSDIGIMFDEAYLYTGNYLMDTSYTKWIYLFRIYLGLGQALGYDEEFILNEYVKKYEKNLNRVKVGY